uniref:Uncharacterized protein n=1 Tax=Medicago truncatula TaxID=3880 RepID=Q2HRV9_MEDTR|nr:hypothetical protein MtrDRAFT_AC157890g13v2 [Medicago truncatula]
MASRNIQTLLSYHCLTDNHIFIPLCNQQAETEYRSYIVEYDIDVGAICLPNMFGGDFGYQIGRYAILTDPKSNKFEVLVDRVNGAFFLTKGWKAIRDFYGIDLGA